MLTETTKFAKEFANSCLEMFSYKLTGSDTV